MKTTKPVHALRASSSTTKRTAPIDKHDGELTPIRQNAQIVSTSAARTASALAAQLSRQALACSYTAEEIGEDALLIARLGEARRASLLEGREACSCLREIERIAEKYQFSVVTNKLEGGTVAIRFQSGPYHRTNGNLFYLA